MWNKVKKFGRKVADKVQECSRVVKAVAVAAAVAIGMHSTSVMAADADGDGIPDSPIDVTTLADSAFTGFGGTITTCVPYMIALALLFVVIRYVLKIARGRAS